MGKALPVALLALAVLGSLSAVWWPMSTDHALFAWVGDVIVQGGVPYRDAWELKGPAVYLQSALVQTLFGRNLWGIRVLDLLLLAAGAVSAAVVARRASDDRGTLWAPLLMVLLYIPSGWWNTAQPDGWAVFLGTAALALVFVRGGRWPLRGLAAGLLLGWLCMYKPPLHLLLVPVVLLAARPEPEAAGRRAHLRALSPVLVGMAVPILAVVGWLAATGALDDARAVLVGYNAEVYSGVEMGRDDLHKLLWLPLLSAAPIILLSLAGCVLMWRTQRRLTAALLAWMLAGATSVALQRKLFGYHWHAMIPPVALGAAIGLGHLERMIQEYPKDTPARRIRQGSVLCSWWVSCWW